MRGESSSCPALVGRGAPDFELPSTCGSPQSRRNARLQAYRGRWLVLVFYPRDFSLVCPTELSAVDARSAELIGRGADVLAVSNDSVETHERWIATPPSRGGLGPIHFPLASDLDGRTARAYGAWCDASSAALRALAIIDPNGIVQYHVIHNIAVGRRVDEVMRVLAACQAGGLCAEGWAPGRDTVDTSELAPGTVLSHYRVERKLGTGGFGAVYLAHDLLLERAVAVKIPRKREHWAPDALREARAAAALNHQNVCTVFGVDETHGVLLIVMEYLVGRPLDAVLAEGPIAGTAAVHLARQIAAGLRAAHAAGVVHGDLKPANVFLTRERVVKIVDFGLAARVCVPSSGGRTASLGGDSRWIAGTPAYMSPEQAEGEPPSPDSDVYAFGLVLYEMLTGVRALDGDNVLHVLKQARAVVPEALGDALGEPFGGLLRRMLDPVPRHRPGIDEIAARLAAIEERIEPEAQLCLGSS